MSIGSSTSLERRWLASYRTWFWKSPRFHSLHRSHWRKAYRHSSKYYDCRISPYCLSLFFTYLLIYNILLWHLCFQCPNNAGSTYYNYKHAHSIVLLAICDANYLFRFVDIGAYGRRSDGGIFQDCVIGQKFDADEMNVPKPAAIAGGRVLPYCLVGNEAFPLKIYMLRPYPGRNGLTDWRSKIFTIIVSAELGGWLKTHLAS